MGLSYDTPGQPELVPYMDLGGGLNTRMEPHALARNELAVSQNLWSAYDQAVAKRPGTNPLITSNGAAGDGLGAISLSSCRYGGYTYLIKCNTNREIWVALVVPAYVSGSGTGWHKIGNVSASASFITTAQMFDPDSTPAVSMTFICDGFSVPQMWDGNVAHTLVNVTTGFTTQNWLPNKYNLGTGNPITPQYVKTLGNNSHLFYSGDPSNPSAVYISDPLYPQRFNNPSMQTNIDGTVSASQYYPAIIGNNDGVEGGSITGLETIGSAMLVFKESAIYSMIQTTLLGEIPVWQVVQVSPCIGCTAPRTITKFTTFIVFLSIDGVYLTDGNTLQKISGDVPTYFDGSFRGVSAIVEVRTKSIGVRHGNRYLIFFPTTAQAIIAQSYCDTGLWFDFDKQSRFGNPIVGEIDGMNVGGAVRLGSPLDSGNVAWSDALQDRTGEFGVGFSDFGANISTLWAGKADMFDDVFGPEQVACRKQMQDAYCVVEVLAQSNVQSLDFYGTVFVDFSLQLARVISQPVTAGAVGGHWGDLWGAPMVWSSSAQSNLSVIKIPMQNGARGYALQVAVKESSTVPWIILGYGCYVNKGKTGH